MCQGVRIHLQESLFLGFYLANLQLFSQFSFCGYRIIYFLSFTTPIDPYTALVSLRLWLILETTLERAREGNIGLKELIC